MRFLFCGRALISWFSANVWGKNEGNTSYQNVNNQINQILYHLIFLDEVVNKFTEVTNDPEVDSVEGIMYTLDTAVIMSGKFVDKVPQGGKKNSLYR